MAVRAVTGLQLAHMLALSGLWIAVNAQFWAWWLPRAGGGDAWLAIAVSGALAYQTTVLPTVFWIYVGRMRRPVHRPAPPGLRVAVITLCVPTFESLEVIERQLLAIAAITYAHDGWILDEGDSPMVRAMASAHGIRYFSRAGVGRWNQEAPPHQRATKAGNVNAWLSHVMEADIEYDVFVQLDIDHHPVPSYLDRVLGHLDDPSVAWVQAPSVCGNLESWTARGLAEQDLVLNGPLQMGFFGATRTPFIIGSHTTYRMSAIREIGGFQPTRAEDHLDTVVLAARGHRGVYVPEIIATGDGPGDLGTYLRQQFAWAHSMITVFLTWTPRLLLHYRPAQAMQFIFCQSWYVMWSISLLVLWSAPALALLTGAQIAQADFWDYVVYAVPLALVGWIMWCFARPYFQPSGVRLSWRGAVLTIARWPVVLWALVGVILRIKRPYMITPKPGRRTTVIPGGAQRAAVIYGPLIGLAALPVLAVWASAYLVEDASRSYIMLTLLNGAVPLIAFATTLWLEVRQRGRAVGGLARALVQRGGCSLCLVALIVGWTAATIDAWSAIVESVT